MISYCDNDSLGRTLLYNVNNNHETTAINRHVNIALSQNSDDHHDDDDDDDDEAVVLKWYC